MLKPWAIIMFKWLYRLYIYIIVRTLFYIVKVPYFLKLYFLCTFILFAQCCFFHDILQIIFSEATSIIFEIRAYLKWNTAATSQMHRSIGHETMETFTSSKHIIHSLKWVVCDMEHPFTATFVSVLSHAKEQKEEQWSIKAYSK